jgi:hypothetical protein
MKAIFLLDRLDETGKVVEENVRALEILPSQFQLKETEEFLTWLCFPVGDQSNLVTAKFVPLVAFPVGLKRKPAIPDAALKVKKLAPAKKVLTKKKAAKS